MRNLSIKLDDNEIFVIKFLKITVLIFATYL